MKYLVYWDSKQNRTSARKGKDLKSEHLDDLHKGVTDKTPEGARALVRIETDVDTIIDSIITRCILDYLQTRDAPLEIYDCDADTLIRYNAPTHDYTVGKDTIDAESAVKHMQGLLDGQRQVIEELKKTLKIK